MIVRFDSLNRFETPKFYLCSPGSVYKNGIVTGVAGILTDTQDEELVLNFNAVSELNFRLNRVNWEDPEENAFAYRLFRTVQNRRLIFVDDIGFFSIVSVKDGFDGQHHYKDVQAQSCEVEIQNKKVPYIEDGTYKFTDLLEQIVATVQNWTIGTVDSNVAALYRTFEDVSEDLNCLGFLMESMQDAYECIFVFDCINRTINVYDQNNYVERTSIHITKDDLINSVDITENSDDLYTAITVMGDEDLNIAAVNPLGNGTIYNFDYYIPWMSSALQERLAEWKAAYAASITPYQKKNQTYYELLEQQADKQLNLQKTETQLTMYRRCRDNIIAESSTAEVSSYNEVIVGNGGEPITVSSDIATTVAGIDDLILAAQSEYDRTQSALAVISEQMNTLQQEITAIRTSVSLENFLLQAYPAFSEIDENGIITVSQIDENGIVAVESMEHTGQELLDELMNYIFEGSYTDEYIGVTSDMTYSEKFEQMHTLFTRAVSQLQKVSQPTQEFNIDVENFLFAKEFENFSDQLRVGSLINVELDDDDIAELFLSTITVNYDDCSLSMTFGNRFNRFDPKSLFENVLGDIQKSANTLNFVKDILYPIKNGEFNQMKEYLENSRTLTKNLALSAVDQEIVIDDTGYTGRKMAGNNEYDSRQVKLTHNILVFTDDAWDTCKVAIGEIVLPDGSTAYGINTKYLIGDMIIGNNLQIKDNNGNDLLTVMDGKIATSVGDAMNGVQQRLTEIQQTADNVSIKVSNFTDANGDLIVDHVTTTTGYTFNADGLRVSKSGEEIENKITNDGMYVKRGDDNLLTVNNEGVNAINITTRQYLVIGEHARFEQYGDRTACFYIGG